MSTKVQICNMALSRLGAAIITSMTDGTPNAKLCNTLFDDLADRVLVQGSWTIAVVRASLAQSSTAPSYGYAHAYQLPTSPKCLRVLDVEGDPDMDYRIEGDKLLSDFDEINLRYIGRPVSTEQYSSGLTEAIEALLASYLAYPITGSKELADLLKREYVSLVADSLARDGQQGSKDELVISDLIDIRY